MTPKFLIFAWKIFLVYIYRNTQKYNILGSWKKVFAYIYFVILFDISNISAAISIKNVPKILDIACASGIWVYVFLWKSFFFFINMFLPFGSFSFWEIFWRKYIWIYVFLKNVIYGTYVLIYIFSLLNENKLVNLCVCTYQYINNIYLSICVTLWAYV